MRIKRIYRLMFMVAIIGMLSPAISTVSAQEKNDKKFAKLLRKNASPLLLNVLNNPNEYQYQIIYTEINRDKNNKPRFKYHYFNVDRNRYFYPASTVKLPGALISLEKLNNLNVDGLNKYSAMITDSAYSGQTRVLKDPTSATGLPSVAHYVKKIFFVSDNDAYNRLYEFCGQKYLNDKLAEKGYTDVRLTKRLVHPLSEDENKHTNPIRFYNGDKLVYEQPAQFNETSFDFSKEAKGGRGYMKGKELINESMNFTRNNWFPLQDQQQILQSVMFPGSTKKGGFNLTADDYAFLYKTMSTLPFQSDFPKYDTKEFFDSYAKFFMYRAGEQKIPDHIKIYNKAGWSYGTLTDNSYIIDHKNNVEFMVAAVIYTNKDGILNDDKYDYEEIGYPFFKEVGEIIYKHELERKRKYKPVFTF